MTREIVEINPSKNKLKNESSPVIVFMGSAKADKKVEPKIKFKHIPQVSIESKKLSLPLLFLMTGNNGIMIEIIFVIDI